MLYKEVSVSDIQDFLGIDDNTIYRYVKAYQKVGLQSYLKDGYIPYSGKLAEEQERQLSAHLIEHCYPDAKSICAYVEQEYGVRYTPSGIVPLLHRLGFVYKRTKVVPSKAKEEEQIAFLNQTLPNLLDQADKGEAVVYFSDGCHPTHNTKSSRGWIKAGQDFEVDCNSGRRRVNINAAVNALKPEHLVYDIADTINAQSTRRLAQKLLRKHPRKTIYLICDNARYNRNKMLQQWAKEKRIEFVFLPAYSPNLNLIERLWRLLRSKAINSIYYEKYQEFRQSIIPFSWKI